jgi:hypothetical protein
VRFTIPRPGQMVEPAKLSNSETEAAEWWKQ